MRSPTTVRRLWLVANIAALGACASAPSGPGADSASPGPAPGTTVATPATYAGTLPCADCPGIEWTLTLLEDGSYRLRRVYLEAEAGGNRAFVELGRWDGDAASGRLALRGGSDGPIRFAVVDAQSLRLLDRRGQTIASSLDYALARRATLDRIDEAFRMRGEFVYLADAGRFTPCGTRVSFPVAQVADNAALERAYLAAAAEPAAPVLVSFDGRFAMRAPMEGDGLREFVVVEGFGEAHVGQGCEGAVDPAPGPARPY